VKNEGEEFLMGRGACEGRHAGTTAPAIRLMFSRVLGKKRNLLLFFYGRRIVLPAGVFV
jgi:hypothetical protein